MYSYIQEIKNDVLDYLGTEGFNITDYELNGEIDYDYMLEKLSENGDLMDAATGMYNNAYEVYPDQEECGRRLVDAMDFEGRNLLAEMFEEFEAPKTPMASEIDTMLREYLFYEALSDLVGEIEIEFGSDMNFEGRNEKVTAKDLKTLYDEVGEACPGVTAMTKTEIVEEMEDDIWNCIDGIWDWKRFRECEDRDDLEAEIEDAAIGEYDFLMDEVHRNTKNEKVVIANIDLVFAAIEEYDIPAKDAFDNCEAADELIRNMLLSQAVSGAADELEEEMKDIERVRSNTHSLGIRIADAEKACQSQFDTTKETKEKETER